MGEKRNKPLPEGYVCKACGSSEHSIHDCPNKIPKKQKTNVDLISSSSSSQKSPGPKKDYQKAVPSEEKDKDKSKKVYISGLPFHITKPKLKEILEEKDCDVAFIQLVCFPDNPSKCKGVAFVTFRDESSAQKAIELTGTEMEGKTLKVEPYRSDTGTTSSASQSQQVTGDNKGDNKRCYRCGGKHEAKTCTNPRICYRCKSADHLSFACPLKKAEVNPRKKIFNDAETDS